MISKLHFRSITPLDSWDGDHCDELSFHGVHRSQRYFVSIRRIQDWNNAKELLLGAENESNARIMDWASIELTYFPQWALVIDDFIDSASVADMTKINTLTGAELRIAVFCALMLHLQCKGPIVRPTLSVRWPHFTHSISGYTAVPNKFLGEAAHIPPAHADRLRLTVEFLLSRSWDGSHSGQIIDVVLELMDARMRAANVRCAYAILATAFEAAFSQKEQDWSGASKRAAALAARTQTERRDFHRRLDSSSQVRGLRNQVLHGRTVDDRKLRANLSFLSEVLSKGVLSLFDDFSKNDVPTSYYDRLLELARNKESSLHK